MPKLKTNKSIAKRVRVTKTGKIKRNKPGRRHLLTDKSAKRKRQLRKHTYISTAQEKTYAAVLHG
jgi:large subunit ribosomal protein L35